jgi:hypothetical protein
VVSVSSGARHQVRRKPCLFILSINLTRVTARRRVASDGSHCLCSYARPRAWATSSDRRRSGQMDYTLAAPLVRDRYECMKRESPHAREARLRRFAARARVKARAVSRRGLALLTVGFLLAPQATSCGASVDPLGTEECAPPGSEPCPSPCTAQMGSLLDRASGCVRTAIALCSRAELSRQQLDRCCVRTADDAVFSLTVGTACPAPPRYSGFRDCTLEENDALQRASSCE